MKLSHVVRLGLVVGLSASVAQAQSLTGSIGGNAFVNNGTNGIVSGPVCDISGVPTQLPAGRSCTFANAGTFGASNVTVSGLASVVYSLSQNRYIYTLNYSFNGFSDIGTQNVQFAFNIPLYNQLYTLASSNITVGVGRQGRGITTLTDGPPAGPLANDLSFQGATALGSFGLGLNPSVTVTRLSGPPVFASASQASGVLPVNAWIDRNLAQVGFNVTTTNYASRTADPGSFNGSGSIVFLSAVVVPEPSTYMLLAMGLGAMTLVARRRRSV